VFPQSWTPPRETVSEEEPLLIGELVALKFLKRDKASTAVTRNAIYRFCQEVRATAKAFVQGLTNVIVEMYGYGRIATLPPASSEDRSAMEQAFDYSFDKDPNADEGPKAASSRHALFHDRSSSELDKLFSENCASIVDCGIDLAELTGDFYVLGLCLMSLEEVLLSGGDPYAQSVGRALHAIGLDTAPLLQQRSQDTVLIEEQYRLRLEAAATGFEDLEQMSKWLNEKEEPRAARFPASVFYQLWKECLQLLKVMHEHSSDKAIGIAHRDLKPANVLVSIDRDLKLRLSDLGFLASVGEIALGNLTLVSCIDEGGVLPAGSKGFRSPEQIESGDEVGFAPLEEGDTSITLFAYIDSAVDPGDWLRVAGQFEDKSSVTRLKTITPKVGSTACELTSPFKKPAGVTKGRLIKDVALHSDLYALGCMAYFFGSEGRNPERFMRQYLDELVMQSFAASLPRWVLQSPLWLAAVLCQDTGQAIIKDLKHLFKDLEQLFVDSSSQQRALDGRMVAKLTFDSHRDLIFASLSNAKSLASLSIAKNLFKREVRQIGAFRRGIADNTSLRDLLIGRTTKQAISFPLLAMTLFCCLRDKEGSIITRGRKHHTQSSELAQLAVYSPAASTFARDLLVIAERLASAPSVADSWPMLSAIGEKARDQFLRARLAGNRHSKQKGDNELPPAAPPQSPPAPASVTVSGTTISRPSDAAAE
jgi:serine/threonine protein kinase